MLVASLMSSLLITSHAILMGSAVMCYNIKTRHGKSNTSMLVSDQMKYDGMSRYGFICVSFVRYNEHGTSIFVKYWRARYPIRRNRVGLVTPFLHMHAFHVIETRTVIIKTGLHMIYSQKLCDHILAIVSDC